METETLSNYEQKHLDNTMDADTSNNEVESVSPVNKTYEESTESTEVESSPVNKTYEESTEVESASPVNKTYEESTESTENKNNSRIELESDEDCDEEEEEKLMLSPAQSDNVYDSDDVGDTLINNDLIESDNEEDKKENNEDKGDMVNEEDSKEEDVKDNDKIEDPIEKSIEEKESEKDKNELDDSNNSKKETSEELFQPLVENVKDKSKESEQTDEKIDEEQNLENVEDEKLSSNAENDDKESEESSNHEIPKDKNTNDVDSEKTKEQIEIIEDEKDGSEEKIEDEHEKENSKEENLVLEENEDKNYEKDNKEEKLEKVQSESKINNDDSKDENSEKSKEEKIEKSKKENNEKSKEHNEESKEDNTEKSREHIEKIKDSNDEKNEEKSIENRIEVEEPENKNDEKDNTQNENSVLKETLSKPLNDGNQNDTDVEMDMDDDFDPSLLCPELSMEVDEAPVITSNDAPAPETDGSKSPLHLYDPIFSTFVDEMTGAEVDSNLTTEELELKAKTYGAKNPIQFTKIHCTACNIHLGSALDGQGNRFVHPLLKVLICKKCYHFYTSGEFEKDEDGSELYCRWCGQGGQVMCCSNCEMVFCKKCIRINFDRKKLADIQKSDEWMCFRCNPSQLIHLRIHCAEFMEYVQSELRRAGSSGNVDSFMNTDYCQCCIPQKKKAPETPSPSQPKKRKRVAGEEDPDYDPTRERVISPIPAIPSTSQQTPVFTPRVAPSPAPVRPNILKPTFRPRVQVLTPPGVRPQQGFVKVMPGGVRLTGPSTSNSNVRTPTLRPIRPTNNTMKHEWFEKTVRAAARVNSNLSYTLTQLNRAQANATSVEALAVVHNKLQEILSSSINSLIQIRKNLRTEFIAGIKNLRFPPKPQPVPTPPSTSSKDDDDVIFVPSEPPPLVVVSSSPPPPSSISTNINLPPSVSLVKKSQTTPKTTPSTPKTTPSTSITIKSQGSGSVAKKSTSAIDNSSRPKGFLRVKSFSALQNVTSECITIPDDLPEDPPEGEKDPLDVSDVMKEPVNGVTNGDEKEENEVKEEDGEKEEDEVKIIEEPTIIITVNDDDKLERLKPAKVILHRSEEIDKMVKTKFMLMNGNSD